MAEPSDKKPVWYTYTPEAVGKELAVDPAKGLGTAEVQQRLQKYGPNRLDDKKKKSGLQSFLEQYQDLMQFVLLGAAIVNQIFTQE
jgi:P-type Ca2+ transporter type 2C